MNFYSPAVILREMTSFVACSCPSSVQDQYCWGTSKAVWEHTLFYFKQNQPDELTPVVKLFVPTCLVLHGIKETFLQRTCKVSLPPKVTGTHKKQQFGCWIEAVLQRVFAGMKCSVVSLTCLSVTLATINASILLHVRLPHLTPILVHRFPVQSSATCSNSSCFRSVITGVFDFSLVCAEWKIADAATNFRQLCTSKIRWQLPAPPTLVASSDV